MKAPNQPWQARPRTAVILVFLVVALLWLTAFAPMWVGVFIPLVAAVLVVLLGVIVTIIQARPDSSHNLSGEIEPQPSHPVLIDPNSVDEKLTKIAEFASANEAAVARNALEAAGIRAFLDGDATATWFWYFGGALGGVKLLVRSSDADQSRAVLFHDAEDEDDWETDADGDWQIDNLDKQEEEEPAPGPSPPITRAWRAAVIGVLFFPPLLNIYSMCVLIRHGLLRGKTDRPMSWRAPAALVVNMIVFSIVALVVYMAVMSQSPSVRPGGTPLEVHKTITIPLLP